MTLSWRVKNGKFASWQTPTSGDVMAPFDNPAANLARVWVHSDFDYYVCALGGPVSSTVTHQAVGAGSTTLGSVTVGGAFASQDQVLYTHNLGYVPRFKVSVGGVLVPNGFIIQNTGTVCRQVSFYATSTEIHVTNVGVSGSAASLGSQAVTYDILIFKQVAEDPLLPVFSARQGILAKGKIRASEKHLRRGEAVGDSPFDINLAPAFDIANGAIRYFAADGSVVTFGTYNGSGSAPANIQCAVS